MDLRGYRMAIRVNEHPEYLGLGDYFGTGKARPRTPEEWVPIAEALSSEHGGVLPRVSWLRMNGYSGLATAMRNTPELFKHIKQDKPLKNSEEWVLEAESLAEEHGGILPCVKWIQKHRPGLAMAMWKWPELFAHMDQQKPQGHHRSAEEWVPFAEALAIKHSGILPCSGWIARNHPGLYNAMHDHPELFKHFSQQKPHGHRRSPEEWVPFAETLAEEHGGVLPCGQWLVDHEYNGLYQALRKRPELFAHIKQERRDTRFKPGTKNRQDLAK